MLVNGSGCEIRMCGSPMGRSRMRRNVLRKRPNLWLAVAGAGLVAAVCAFLFLSTFAATRLLMPRPGGRR